MQSKFSSLTQRINDLVAGLKPTQPIPRDVIGDLVSGFAGICISCCAHH